MAVAIAGAMGAAQATVTIDDSTAPSSWDGNEIVFSDGTGRIEFSGGGVVTGLIDAGLSAGSSEAVAGRQLFQTNERVGAAETAITAAQSNITTLQGDMSTVQGSITTLQGDVGTAQSDITALQGQVGTISTAITTGSVTADTLNVGGGALVADSNGVTLGTAVDMGGNKITNLGEGVIAAGSTDAVTGSQITSLLIDQGAVGIRYFHANSAEADSQAIGSESVAIGPRTTAAGVSSLAAGDGAATTETAEGAIALGQGATAGPAIAGSVDAGAAAIAIGRDSLASASGSVALGDAAQAGGVNAAALGASANASGAAAIALGNATSIGTGSIAAGNGAASATNDSIALGTAAGQGTGTEVNDPGQRHSFIAIGKNAGQNMDGNEAIAIGVSAGSNTTNSQQIAIGTEAGTYLDGERNVSLGYQANHYDGVQSIRHATAVGGLSKAATDGVAVGYAAEAASSGVAVGAGAIADAGSIALGANSHATNVSGASYLTGLAYNGPSVSVGNADTGLTRRITNVADGSADNDAVNVNQLRELKDSLGSFDPQSGGNVNYNPDGTISVTSGTADNSAVNLAQMNTAIAEGQPQYYSVNPNGDAGNIDGSGALGADSANSMAIGHAARIDSAEKATAVGYSVLVKAESGTALGSGSTVDDVAGVALGSGAYSRGTNSVAIGTDAQTEQQAAGMTSDNAIAIGTSARATEDSASALGHRATASGEQSSAVGYFANASGVNSMAFGTESDALAADSQASGTNATASGESSQASGTNALARGTNAIASGTDSIAYADNGIAMGTNAVSGFDAVTPEERLRNQNTIAIGNSALANEFNAMALGTAARATGTSSAAFGEEATAAGLRSTAIGYLAQVDATTEVNGDEGADGIAIGSFAHSSGPKAGAIGPLATSSGNGSYAIGYRANAASDNGVAIGVSSNVTGQSAIAIGMLAEATGGSATSVGVDSLASGSNSTALGRFAEASGGETLAAGYNSEASGKSATAVGAGALANDLNALAMGVQSKAIAASATAIGVNASATQLRDVAMGSQAYTGAIAGASVQQGDNIALGRAQATGGGAIAMGTGAIATSSNTAGAGNAVAIGSQSKASDYNSTALGASASTGAGANYATAIGALATVADGAYSAVALGNASLANGARSTALGRGAVANNLNDVALGADSTTAAAVGTSSATVGGLTYGGFAGTTPASTVSVGGVDNERTVTNVAAGRVSATSTDAINGSQLFATQSVIGNVANSTVTVLGGEAAVDGSGNITMGDNIGGTGESTIDDAIRHADETANMGWNVSANGETTGANVAPGATVDLANTDGNIEITRTGTNLAFELADNVDLGTAGSLTAGYTVVNNDGVAVGPDVTLGNTGLVIANGPSVTVDGINAGGKTITNVAPGVDGTDAVNVDQLTDTVAASRTHYYSVNDNGVQGGNYNNDGATGVNSLAAGVGARATGTGNVAMGLNARSGSTFSPASTQNAVAIGANSGAYGSGAIAVGSSATANGASVAIGQGARTASTFAQSNFSNQSVAIGNDAQAMVDTRFGGGDSVAIGAATRANVYNGTAIGNQAATTAEGGVALGSQSQASTVAGVAGYDPLSGTASTDTSSTWVSTLGAVSVGGNGATRQITNVAAGSADTDAVNVAQLKQVNEVANAGWTATDVNGSNANIGPNGVVTFEGDDNLSVAQTGVDQNGVVSVSLNENIDLGAAGSVTTGKTFMNDDGLVVNDGGNSTVTSTAGTTVVNAAGDVTTVGAGSITVASPGGGQTTIDSNQINVGGSNPIAISGDTGTIGGLTNQSVDYPEFADGSGRAATEEQLGQVNEIANAGWTATDANGNNANIGPNGVVTFEGDDNLSVAQTGVDQNGVVSVSLNENIDLGAAGSVATGNTVMNNDGLAVNDGAGNSTTTTTTGTTVTNAAGNTTTVGAGSLTVADAAGVQTTIGSNQITVGGSNPISISGDTGTIGGLTNQSIDYPEFADGSGRSATEEQLGQVNEIANAGWNVTDGTNSANIGPNGVVTFEGDDNLSVAQTGVDQNGVISVSLNENIDLGAAGSVTTGDTVMNNDGLAVNDGAGNSTTTTAAGTTVTNAAGDTTTVGAGSLTVADAGGVQTTIGSTQINVGGSNPIAISGDTGTIGGLTNTTFDPDNFTSGQAATEDQLKSVSDVANAGWTATDVNGNNANIGPNGVVTFEGDDNLSVAQTGVDQNGVISVNLNENIDLGAAGSVTTGNAVMNNDGLAVNDGAGNSTTTTTTGTTVTNAAGNTTTVGAGSLTVADAAGVQTTIGSNQITVGGSNPIAISGDTGTIGGLTNTTFDPNNFTSGQAATEDQLKSVSDVANAGWTATDANGNSANIGPNGVVTFEGDDNLSVAQTGVDQNGVISVSLNENIDLGAAGSVTTGNTVMNNDGLAVNDGAGNVTQVGAGSISVTDPAGTTVIAGNQVAVGGSSPIVISGDTGTIGGLTNQSIDYPEFADGSGRAATEEQLGQVNEIANAGWNVTDGTNSANIGPNGVVTFEGDDNLSVAQTGVDQNGVISVSLNENIDLGAAGSVTTGDTVMNNDGLAVNDGAGNVTQVGAGSISVTDPAGTTVIAGNQVAVGGSSPIVISGDTGTIGGLTNTTFDPNNFTSGQAATEDQLKSVSDVANAGWTATDANGNNANIGPNGVMTFEGDDNLSVAQTGVDQNGVISVSLNENIDLGAAGSVTTGDTVMNNDGLAVNDGAGNVTAITAAGTTVRDGAGNSTATSALGTTVSNAAGDITSTMATGTTVANAAGDKTTVGAGTISVADAASATVVGANQISVGGSNPVVINGNAGTIRGLTNKTFDPNNFTSGQAATEDQLKSVSDVANAGWTATDADGNSANIGPDGVVTFEGDDNISVAQTGENQDGVIEVSLNQNIDLSATGSITTGNSVMDNDGLSVNDGAGNVTAVGAGAISVTGVNGTTTIGGNEIVIGGLSPIVIGGSTGTITGLTNQTVNYAGFGDGSGRAATEEQLKPVSDFIGLNDDGTFNYNGDKHASLQDALDSMHWNVEAPAPGDSGETGSGGENGGSNGNGSGGNGGSGNGGTGSTPIYNGNTVGFVEGDNIVISKTERPDGSGADVKVSVAKDITVNSVTATTVKADTVNAKEVKIENGPTINQNGIDMANQRIVNVGAGTAPTDAVNLGQLEAATSGLQNQVNQVRGDLNRLNNKLSAGVAAAMATAGLPQAYLPGKSMMSMAGGTYNGESGFAIGVSTVSDNGSWVLKLSGNSNSRGDYGGAVGVGYQW